MQEVLCMLMWTHQYSSWHVAPLVHCDERLSPGLQCCVQIAHLLLGDSNHVYSCDNLVNASVKRGVYCTAYKLDRARHAHARASAVWAEVSALLMFVCCRWVGNFTHTEGHFCVLMQHAELLSRYCVPA